MMVTVALSIAAKGGHNADKRHCSYPQRWQAQRIRQYIAVGCNLAGALHVTVLLKHQH